MARRTALLLLFLALGALPGRPTTAHAQDGGSLLGAGVGAVSGLAAGGYITVAIVVARARFEDEYVFEIEDILDWESIPVIVGPAIGGVIGFFDPGRLYRSVLTGAGGMLVGAAVGLSAGHVYWDTVDGRWAGAAMGAGAGLAVGALVGLIWTPSDADGGASDPAAAGIPLTVRIPL
ncbi:MAG TPA: hypothetical protein VMK65_09995 [Longimicrobiales bacterium]|nr:hypothetical protein [Longimicrobiales bacterium]